ncbi:MAG: hypothetical protein V1926_05430 [Candidatus Peregrinibacteria bacterium]
MASAAHFFGNKTAPLIFVAQGCCSNVPPMLAHQYCQKVRQSLLLERALGAIVLHASFPVPFLFALHCPVTIFSFFSFVQPLEQPSPLIGIQDPTTQILSLEHDTVGSFEQCIPSSHSSHSPEKFGHWTAPSPHVSFVQPLEQPSPLIGAQRSIPPPQPLSSVHAFSPFSEHFPPSSHSSPASRMPLPQAVEEEEEEISLQFNIFASNKYWGGS